MSLVGHRYGALTVLRDTNPEGSTSRFVYAQCDCGTGRLVTVQNLARGYATSCASKYGNACPYKSGKSRQGLLP
jgi:hypothetical protein